MNTFFPTQMAYIPTGNAAGPLTSTFVVGRTISGLFEGAGFGKQGRPDALQVAQINLSELNSDGTYTQRGTITLNVGDVLAAISANSHVPVNLNLTLREVAVCDAGTSKRMIILGSQVYSA